MQPFGHNFYRPDKQLAENYDTAALFSHYHKKLSDKN